MDLKLTIKGGRDKAGKKELIEQVDILCGEIVGIVGPTGSGKSTLINDIEQLACGDTFSQRYILINDEQPPLEMRTNPRKKIIAQLSQNMHFLTDMLVREFLEMHAQSRGKDLNIASEVINLTNELSGEKITGDNQLTILSGGQSRALMIADIALISQSPIVLIDEIENAGIKKRDALKVLTEKGKIVLLITHDPMLALMAHRRIVMANGGIIKILPTTSDERELLQEMYGWHEWENLKRDAIRQGEQLR